MFGKEEKLAGNENVITVRYLVKQFGQNHWFEILNFLLTILFWATISTFFVLFLSPYSSSAAFNRIIKKQNEDRKNNFGQG